MKHKLLVNLGIAFTLISHQPVAHAGTILGTGGALEITQQLNLAELLKIAYDTMHTMSVVKSQLENMKTQGEQLTSGDWGNTFNSLNQLGQAVRQGQSLAYSLGSIDEVYRAKFPAYEDYMAIQPGWDGTFYAGKYRDWSQTNRDTIASAMAAVGMQSEQFADEEATMGTLQALSDSAVGRMQAIQAGNQIAAQQVRQMQKLRELIMLHMQTQSNFQSWEADKDTMHRAKHEQFFNTPPKTIVGNEPDISWRQD